MTLAPESLDESLPVHDDAPASGAPSGEGDATGRGAVGDIAPPPSTILLSNAVEVPAPPLPITLDTPAPPDAVATAPAAARTAPPRDSEVALVPDGVVFDGEALRRARESRGLTVEQICERTRITRQHVENIEADRYESLPAPVYLRGILLALAKQLRLDGQKVARSYMEARAANLPKAR